MKPKKILLVDDEKDFVTTIKYFFEMKGYEVTVACNGAECLVKARDLPNLILMDIKMPDMDGFEALRRLRADRLTMGIPVIMLTASGDTQSIFTAKALKATDYVPKTTELDELLTTVKKHIDENTRSPLNLW